LTDSAAPSSTPATTARRSDGERRYQSAAVTAQAASARPGPSDVSGPVTQSRLPLVATSPAASSAAPVDSRSARAADHEASTSAIPDATASRRGASDVRRPSRSNSQTSGRNNGPWLENTSRKGRPPWRMATADAP
jgi:hypothetical protein